MERIKKALEKARQEQAGLNRQNVAGFYDSDGQVDSEMFAYSQTKKVEVTNDFLKEKRIIAGSHGDPRSDQYKILRTKVLQKMKANNWSLLAVTSPIMGVGKTLTAINLAISIAMDANYSVLLVDLDMRNPKIHEYFGLTEMPGLSEYFSDEKSISELLVHPGLEKMVLLLGGEPIQRSSDLLSTPKMLRLAAELKQRYSDRIVIVNLPPLLQTDDAMMFMPNVDASVLVVAEGMNSEEDVQSSIQLLQPEKYLGSILNMSAEANVTD